MKENGYINISFKTALIVIIALIVVFAIAIVVALKFTSTLIVTLFLLLNNSSSFRTVSPLTSRGFYDIPRKFAIYLFHLYFCASCEQHKSVGL